MINSISSDSLSINSDPNKNKEEEKDSGFSSNRVQDTHEEALDQISK